MNDNSRAAWLASLRLNDPVAVIKTITNKNVKYIEDISADGKMLIGDRWFDPDGTSGTGLWTSYEIVPATKEVADEVHMRQSINFLKGVNWQRYDIDFIESVIANVRAMEEE